MRRALRPALTTLADALQRPRPEGRQQATQALTALLRQLSASAPEDLTPLLPALRRALHILADTPWLGAPEKSDAYVQGEAHAA